MNSASNIMRIAEHSSRHFMLDLNREIRKTSPNNVRKGALANASAKYY